MARILAAHQTNLMPYLGVWEKWLASDDFVWLDDVQFSKGNYQNRVKMMSPAGPRWLSLPIERRSAKHLATLIKDVLVHEGWQKKFFDTLHGWYPECELIAELESVRTMGSRRLSDVNRALNRPIELKFKHRLGFDWLSSTIPVKSMNPTDRLAQLCWRYDCDVYLSGAGGRDYLDVDLLEKSGIRVVFQEFHHPEYPQDGAAFVPGLSIFDALANGFDVNVLIEQAQVIRKELGGF